MALRGIKIFGTKGVYFVMLYKVTKVTVFCHLPLGVAQILSVGLSDEYNSLLETEFSYLQWLMSYSC